MKNRLAAVSLLGAALTLSGCQSFPFLGLGGKPKPELGPQDLSDYFGQRLADGRRHLDAGRNAAAITAFRQASYDPSRAAQSYNGMAVAYAKLGRSDLAERYFEAALRIDPRNESYARNLARLDDNRLEQLREGAVEMASATGAGPSEATARDAAEALVQSMHVAVEPRQAQLQRVSDHEVHIATLDRASDMPAASDKATALAANGRQARPGYPIRIELPDAEPGKAPTARPNVIRIELKDPEPYRKAEKSGYPIRIALSDVPRR